MNFQNIIVSLVVAGVVGFFSGQYATKASTASNGEHKVVIQVSSNDPATMNLALNNVKNVMDAFKGNVKVELVAYGPGLDILTADNAASNRVTGLIKDGATFSACGNTIKARTKQNNGVEPILTDGVQVVPGGIVRIMELQSQGYTYVRP